MNRPDTGNTPDRVAPRVRDNERVFLSAKDTLILDALRGVEAGLLQIARALEAMRRDDGPTERGGA